MLRRASDRMARTWIDVDIKIESGPVPVGIPRRRPGSMALPNAAFLT